METPSFKVKLYRGLELLGDTLNTERSLLGPFSDRAEKPWGLAEQEQNIALDKIVELDTAGGSKSYKPTIPLHSDTWYELQKMFPQLQTGEPLVDERGRPLTFNSNILPKIGSVINESLLALGMTYGTRIEETGRYHIERSSISDDVIIATMLYKTMGKTLKSTDLTTGKTQKVGDALIKERFGQGVLDHVHGLQLAHEQFDKAVHNIDGVDTEALQSIDPQYSNSILAIESAELREAIRIKGNREFELVDSYTHLSRDDHNTMKNELRAKLSSMGLHAGDFSRAQDQLLAKELKEVEAALSLNGLEDSIQKTVQEEQVDVVKRVVNREDGWPPERLVGYEGESGDRNGQALAMFHQNLPIMHFEVSGNENHEATLVKALMEASRYHHNSYRKGNNSIIGHLVQTAATGSRDLGESLRPIVATTLVMHDLAEDGGAEVAGLNNSLEMIRNRFSPLVAELVADLTDADDKRQSHKQAQAKARQTKELESFVFADTDTRWTSPTRPLTPTNPDRPYSLTGAGPKIGDRRATMLELLQDPDYMSGYSAHSGWRVGWRMNSKGFVDDVVDHIAQQISKFDDNEDSFTLPGNNSLGARKALISTLRDSLTHEFQVDDMFMVQNLTILADEFNLSNTQRKDFICNFTNKDMDWDAFEQTLEQALPEEAIKAQIASEAVPGLDYSVMYKRGATRDDPPVRSNEALKAYRDSFMHRLEMREQIQSPPLDYIEGDEIRHMLQHYDKRKGYPPQRNIDVKVNQAGPVVHVRGADLPEVMHALEALDLPDGSYREMTTHDTGEPMVAIPRSTYTQLPPEMKSALGRQAVAVHSAWDRT